jgi:hypothetical protein
MIWILLLDYNKSVDMNVGNPYYKVVLYDLAMSAVGNAPVVSYNI